MCVELGYVVLGVVAHFCCVVGLFELFFLECCIELSGIVLCWEQEVSLTHWNSFNEFVFFLNGLGYGRIRGVSCRGGQGHPDCWTAQNFGSDAGGSVTCACPAHQYHKVSLPDANEVLGHTGPTIPNHFVRRGGD